jgi:opacity protein-like surface antigen
MPQLGNIYTLQTRRLRGFGLLVAFRGVLLGGLLSASSLAAAADLPSSAPVDTGPYTISPQAATVDPWHGFYVGSGVTGSFAKGAKGAFGADGYAGYDHRFDNGLVLGAQFNAGYMPWASTNPQYKGFDYAGAEVKLGYEMGRFTPYVMTGVALTKGSSWGGAPAPGEALNALFSAPGALQANGFAGAGVQYQVTDKLSVGVETFVGNGPAVLTH